jgi:hypothetical protein
MPIAAIFAPLCGDIAARASAASAVRRAHTPVMPSTPPVDRMPYSATVLGTPMCARVRVGARQPDERQAALGGYILVWRVSCAVPYNSRL